MSILRTAFFSPQHVDFDCLFDKGMTLQRPEIVPFRLSPNMLDGMGVSGFEGVFRRVCEISMGCVRSNRDMLMSVLESFIHDPLVEWQSSKSKPAEGSSVPQPRPAAGEEIENEDGLRIISKIADRLDGGYNIGVEFLPVKNGSNSSRARAFHKASAGRVSHSPIVRLAIPGQVHRLLKEATSDENMALMYLGW